MPSFGRPPYVALVSFFNCATNAAFTAVCGELTGGSFVEQAKNVHLRGVRIPLLDPHKHYYRSTQKGIGVTAPGTFGPGL